MAGHRSSETRLAMNSGQTSTMTSAASSDFESTARSLFEKPIFNASQNVATYRSVVTTLEANPTDATHLRKQ